jgi:glucosamine--fructose-6-phosphate aminotransferase (isomerizing)
MHAFGTLTYPEISDQANALSAAMEQVALRKQWIDVYLNNPSYSQVVFIGSGSSYYQAQTMAATYRKWLGRSAAALPSSDIFLFPGQSVAGEGKKLLVGVSRSGESSEVILAINSVKSDPDWDVCGITCHEDSTLACISDCLVSPLGKEKSTVMTKSFSSMTFMMQCAIAAAAGESSPYWTELEATRSLDAAQVENADRTAKQLAEQRSFSNFIYLGMGALNGIAQEACLKLKEMSYVWTESFGTLEFRHGPKSIIDDKSFVCVLLSETARSYELKVAEEMKGYGAFVTLLTAQAGAETGFADLVVDLGGSAISDEARAVLYLPFLQYFGYYTALQKGVDPDHPRNLTQVVKI